MTTGWQLRVPFVGGSLDGRELPVPIREDGTPQPLVRVESTGEVYEMRYSRAAIGAGGKEYAGLRYVLR